LFVKQLSMCPVIMVSSPVPVSIIIRNFGTQVSSNI
jgi:hypothetical protein